MSTMKVAKQRIILSSLQKFKTGFSRPISLVGQPGIGKTSLIKACVDELSQIMGEEVGCVFKSVHQFENMSELYGMPDVIQEDGKLTTVYALPDWVDFKQKYGVLIIDDYSRAKQDVLGAIMPLLNHGVMNSWKLPETWYVLLSENPDDGFQNVQYQDTAQKSRKHNIEVSFDTMFWATEYGYKKLPPMYVDFVVKNPNFFVQQGNQAPEVSIRSWTNFAMQFDYALKNGYSLKNSNDTSFLNSIFEGEGITTSCTSAFKSFSSSVFSRLPTIDEMLDMIAQNELESFFENLISEDSSIDKITMDDFIKAFMLRLGVYLETHIYELPDEIIDTLANQIDAVFGWETVLSNHKDLLDYILSILFPLASNRAEVSRKFKLALIRKANIKNFTNTNTTEQFKQMIQSIQ